MDVACQGFKATGYLPTKDGKHEDGHEEGLQPVAEHDGHRMGGYPPIDAVKAGGNREGSDLRIRTANIVS